MVGGQEKDTSATQEALEASLGTNQHGEPNTEKQVEGKETAEATEPLNEKDIDIPVEPVEENEPVDVASPESFEEKEKLESLPDSPISTASEDQSPTVAAVTSPTIPTTPDAATESSSEKPTTLLPPQRPPLHRGDTKLAQKKAKPFDHIGITFGLPMIVLFDIVVPCIIYYTWYNNRISHWRHQCRDFHLQNPDTTQRCPVARPEFDKDILGSAIASFGIGELYILIARVWRLFYRREDCAPLLSRNRWELDATSWVYLVAMLMALVPFTVGSVLEITELYLYGPAFLMAFLGVLMVVTTLHPFKIPIGINSHARGSGLRPFIYYAAEDFIAVDGLQDREFRVRYNERYETNKAFRQMFVYLTLWWELGVLIYIGALSAVIWTLPFHVAFGLSLGILFGYIVVWAAVTYVWVQIEMSRENKALADAIGEC